MLAIFSLLNESMKIKGLSSENISLEQHLNQGYFLYPHLHKLLAIRKQLSITIMLFDCSDKCSMQKLSPYIIHIYYNMLNSRNPIVSISTTLIIIVVNYLCYQISQLKAVAWLSLRTRIWFTCLSIFCYSLSSSYDSLNNTFEAFI